MKKQLICIMAAAAMLAAAPAALASEGVTYDLGKKSVTVDGQDQKKIVLITNSDNDIVYVNQADSTFQATDEFLLKNDVTEGTYTIKLGADSGEAVTIPFTIGMSEASGDVKLTMPTEGGEATNSDGKTKNIGYTANNVSGTYKSVIIQKNGDDKYYGITLGTVMTLDNAAVGIQINGVSDTTTISKVWLSQRGIATASDAAADAE